MKVSPNAACPCQSELKFKRCCRPLLDGSAAASPEALMRSRYTAYATGDAAHIMATTHAHSPHFSPDSDAWKEELEAFCGSTGFEGLEVVSSRVEGDRGWVEFVASLSKSGKPALMTEHSEFQRVEGRWLYLYGLDSN